jgi:hypothetical protein
MKWAFCDISAFIFLLNCAQFGKVKYHVNARSRENCDFLPLSQPTEKAHHRSKAWSTDIEPFKATASWSPSSSPETFHPPPSQVKMMLNSRDHKIKENQGMVNYSGRITWWKTLKGWVAEILYDSFNLSQGKV